MGAFAFVGVSAFRAPRPLRLRQTSRSLSCIHMYGLAQATSPERGRLPKHYAEKDTRRTLEYGLEIASSSCLSASLDSSYPHDCMQAHGVPWRHVVQRNTTPSSRGRAPECGRTLSDTQQGELMKNPGTDSGNNVRIHKHSNLRRFRKSAKSCTKPCSYSLS